MITIVAVKSKSGACGTACGQAVPHLEIDLDQDVLKPMEFAAIVRNVQPMPARQFSSAGEPAV